MSLAFTSKHVKACPLHDNFSPARWSISSYHGTSHATHTAPSCMHWQFAGLSC